MLGLAVFGAFVGSKLLHIAEHLPYLLAKNDPALWLGGKSVLGGLLGGTAGVELAKKMVGWTRSTGDAWVLALFVGMSIGRVGCQLSGPWDQTYGTPTALPWGWNYGDGVPRHPTALYEIALLAISCAVALKARFARHLGAGFAFYLGAYCCIRFVLEFLKPPFGPSIEGTLPVSLYGGLSAIQWAALAGALYFTQSFFMKSKKAV